MSDSPAPRSERPSAEGSPPPPKNHWAERVEEFAKAVSQPVVQIENALITLVGQPSEDAAHILADVSAIQDSDLQDALVKAGPMIPLGVFRKHLSKLRGPAPTVEPGTGRPAGPSFDVLPQVPDDNSFTEMLKVGGILKVGTTEMIAGTRAALADAVGVFELPDKIVEQMETFALAQDEPVGDDFFRLQKMVVERNYGEILSALGVSGRFVSQKRKNELLRRLQSGLWPALSSFNVQLKAWQDSWAAGMANPAVMLAALTFGQGGHGSMAQNMLQAPDTSTIRDAADSVVDRINRVFAGTGIPVARALAHDATGIKKVLEDPQLPMAIGAANREQMLKQLGVNVSADYVRLEQNITRFVLAIVDLPKVTAGNEEYAYLAALIQLGSAIPWDKLPAGESISSPRNQISPPSRRRVGIGADLGVS